MTVSRVLNGRGYVAQGTAARVREVLERLQYRPNPAARLLRGRRSHLVGVTIPSLISPIHRGVVNGLEEVLGAAEYQLLLGHLQFGSRQSATFVESIRRQNCDGYVIVPSRADARLVSMPRLDRPLVVAFTAVPGLVSDAVLADGEPAAREATRYLLERFGAPVAYINVNTGLSHDLSTLRGYCQAVRAWGAPERVLLFRSPREDCGPAVRGLFATTDPPKAILLASTLVAFEVLGQLVQLGFRIGHDLGLVATVAEERAWTALFRTPLPLLVVPAREIGRRAGELLLRRLNEGPAAEPATLTLPTRFLATPAGAEE